MAEDKPNALLEEEDGEPVAGYPLPPEEQSIADKIKSTVTARDTRKTSRDVVLISLGSILTAYVVDYMGVTGAEEQETVGIAVLAAVFFAYRVGRAILGKVPESE